MEIKQFIKENWIGGVIGGIIGFSGIGAEYLINKVPDLFLDRIICMSCFGINQHCPPCPGAKYSIISIIILIIAGMVIQSKLQKK